jgi:hypothetical protein
MLYTLFALVGFGAYLGWFYWRRNQQIQLAGGAQQYHDQLQRKQFGLGPNERVLRYWTAQLYLGKLRPDQGPGTLEKVAFAVVGGSFRGAVLSVALTDQGRLAIAREMIDEENLMDQAARMRGESSGQLPFRLWGPPAPKPRVRTAEEAFGGNPGLTAELTEGRGRTLLHFDAPEGPLTIWVDSAGVPEIRQWSAT